MLKFLLDGKCLFALYVLTLTFGQCPCYAQGSKESPQESPPYQGSVADEQVPPAIRKELDAMRAPIEQLEAELKSRKALEQPAAPQAPAPAKAAEQALVARSGLTKAATPPDPMPRSSHPAHAVDTPSVPAQGATTSGKHAMPFAFGDFTWLNGNPRTHDSPLDGKVFSGEVRVDSSYIYDYNHPIDHSLGGTTEGARTGEFQVQHLGVGGDFHWQNMQARILTQFGIYATATPRNDASPSIGQWNLSDAYRYVTEAWGGYHLNVQSGINIQAGIFLSYIGLFSYYNFDNWTYQPSYVSSNTPWFFNGMRVQWFPTDKLKIEPWLINGWQSYGKFNGRPGVGGQILWRPTSWFSFVGNQYGVGQDTVGLHRTRWHTDDSIEVKYYEVPANLLDRMAFSLTIDAGCESGGG